MDIRNLALAFVAGKTGKCHNARIERDTDGAIRYVLHRSTIATLAPGGRGTIAWCGFYTATTANHINKILRAVGDKTGEYRSVSRAFDRDNGVKTREFSV